MDLPRVPHLRARALRTGRHPHQRPAHDGFLVVCVAEIAVGGLLWWSAPHAEALAYALLPFEAVFWIGFALPFGPPVGLARTVLLLLA